MYEKFLEKNLNSIRQAVDDTFIAKYADMSYAELTTLWQEAGLGSYHKSVRLPRCVELLLCHGL